MWKEIVLASLHKHDRCIDKCGLQSVETIKSGCKNGFLMFHTSYCNILPKTDQIEKENSTKHHLPERVFMERLCCSCSKKKNSGSKLFGKILTN